MVYESIDRCHGHCRFREYLMPFRERLIGGERDALALGATQFLTKPFSPKKLYALVARLTGAPDEAGISGE